MINKNESIKKVINNSFDTLEDKVNNISQSTRLTVKDIVDKDKFKAIEIFQDVNLPYKLKNKLNQITVEHKERHYGAIPEKDLIWMPESTRRRLSEMNDDVIKYTYRQLILHEFAHYYIASKLTDDDFKDYIESHKNPIRQHPNEQLSDDFANYILFPKYLKKEEPETFKFFKMNENKLDIDNLSKQLTGEDIFDITTTGMSYYNSMIQKGHIVGNRDPVEYFKTNKGLVFEIVYMTPTHYLEESYKIHNIEGRYGEIKFSDYVRDTVNLDLVENYKERTLEGSKMPIPLLDYNNISQEGRHRAIVAQQLEVEEIPVLVVRPYEE